MRPDTRSSYSKIHKLFDFPSTSIIFFIRIKNICDPKNSFVLSFDTSSRAQKKIVKKSFLLFLLEYKKKISFCILKSIKTDIFKKSVGQKKIVLSFDTSSRAQKKIVKNKFLLFLLKYKKKKISFVS